MMRNSSIKPVKQPIYLVLLTLMMSACQQPATYAPVKTVNQAILTEDEIKLRKAREQRRLGQANHSGIAQQSSPLPQKTSDGQAPEIANISPGKYPPPVSPELLPPARKLEKPVRRERRPDTDKHQQPSPKPSYLSKVNKPVNPPQKAAEPAHSTVPEKPGRQPIQNKPTQLAAKPANESRNPGKPDKNSTQTKKNEKNPKEKTLSISNINKKVLKLNFEWPVRGKVVRNFAQSENKGIDIAGKIGQTVHAAEAGKTVYCGNGLTGLGNLVIVKHNENYLSAYAHNSRLRVTEGQAVEKGQAIAEIGRSGSRQPVLHFQIRKNGKSLNPLTLLPKH